MESLCQSLMNIKSVDNYYCLITWMIHFPMGQLGNLTFFIRKALNPRWGCLSHHLGKVDYSSGWLGLLPRIGSMRCITSGVSFGTTSRAFMFSCTCSGRLAPVMTVLTLGFLRHQARANCDRVQPRSPAMGT